MILANLQSRHVQAIQLLLKGELKDKEIAQQLGVRPDTLAKWKASPVFQQRYQLERHLGRGSPRHPPGQSEAATAGGPGGPRLAGKDQDTI